MTKLTQNRASSISVPASRLTFAGLASLVLALAASPFACASQPEEETSCGPGTALANGQCIPVAQCGAGTALVNGTCVPVSGQGGASGTGAAGEGGGGSGATGGTSAAGGGQGGSQSGGSAGSASGSGGSAGDAGASGGAQAGASGSQPSGGASGAGGSGGASGSGLVDAPCPDKAPAFNCSDTCGPKSDGCDQETCTTCNGGFVHMQLTSAAAFPAIIRTKSAAGVEAGCSTACGYTVPNFQSPKHTMRIGVTGVLDEKTPRWFRVTTMPTDAWVMFATDPAIQCCLQPYVSTSCIVIQRKDPFIVQFLATKDDAPAQNAMIEMSNSELTCP